MASNPSAQSSSSSSSTSIIFGWLERIGLGYALPQFQALGITTPQALANVDLAQGAADQLLIHDDEDKKRLWELIHRIRAVRLRAALRSAGARAARARARERELARTQAFRGHSADCVCAHLPRCGPSISLRSPA